MPVTPKIKNIILTLIILFTCQAHAGSDQPPPIGNFALPCSQQPGPLLSFGQNIVEKGQTQLYLFADDYRGVQEHFVDVMPGVVYGLRDNLSLFFNVPYAASYQQGPSHSSGLEDVFLQLEYTAYTKQTNHYADTVTLVGNTSFPTGSSTKQPPTGYGSSTYFLGGTFNRTYVDWFGFTSDGILLTTSHNGTKFGNTLLYQFGIGRNISSVTSQFIFASLLELDGTFSQKSQVSGVTDPNSGGNIVYATPSLWFSTKKLIVQFGVGFPVTQHWFGNQAKSNYLIATNIGWTL